MVVHYSEAPLYACTILTEHVPTMQLSTSFMVRIPPTGISRPPKSLNMHVAPARGEREGREGGREGE